MKKGNNSRKWALGALFGLAVAGAALAVPPQGWELTYYDAQGNAIGGKERTCWGGWYSWGQTSSTYDVRRYSCD